MRFLIRGLFGIGLLAVTAGLLVLAVGTVYDAFEGRQDAGNRPRADRERAFSANVRQITSLSIRPVIENHGEIRSGRTLELRAASGGAIVELSESFREGGMVRKGDLLFQTDPAPALASLRLAEADLEEAAAELRNAEVALDLSEADVRVAETQLELRRRAQIRQESLKDRGVGTETALETAGLAVSVAEQSVVGKRIALSQAGARAERARLALSRRVIARDEAVRQLEDTSVHAGFDGVLTGVRTVLGGLVNANEKLGDLIDPKALEVVFRVTNREFDRLVAATGGLEAVDVEVIVSPESGAVPARLDRVGASVGDGQTGRELFATLGDAGASRLRSGDFVTVRVREPELRNVTVIPATAASASGEVLVLGEDNRLKAVTAVVLRKQGDELIVDGAGLVGETIVLERVPQLGAGIRVQPRESGAPLFEDPPTVILSAEERTRLSEAVRSNSRMPEAIRNRILEQLAAGELPVETVERLRRMAGRVPSGQTGAGNDSGEGAGAGASRTGGGDGGGSAAAATDSAEIRGSGSRGNPGPESAAGSEPMVTLTDEDRQKLIAFVEGNSRIPEDRKTQLLRTLAEPQVPSGIVDRIRSRMGG
ncbi:MAG: MFP transporter [Paracoccaceae bacterium]|nr:MFP transporter [Paracoccaceae bacterium]MDE2913525.1 MFP transporter [Paracoccaceae bacterium]